MTLVDALRLRELNLLILSYLFRQTHNTFIRENTYYGATDAIQSIYYYIGAIVGVLLTGILSDVWLVGKRFLMIFLLNSLLLVWDIYLFVSASPSGQDELSKGGLIAFSLFLGTVLESNDLIYLILMPMLIAKNHSDKMSQLSQYQRVCFAGTIVGVTLALCMVGKYLFSDNLATFFDYLVREPSTGDCKTQIGFSDAIALLLLFMTNFVLWEPVKRELRQTRFYRFVCCIKHDDLWRSEDDLPAMARDDSEEVQPLGGMSLSPRWNHLS